uniref:Uncharacterized protein n=1 Tax=Schistosoma japonicum TaxID=6182 RepID=Q5BZC6_SCHJA|nr:unknown [Schistosoma japonicum]
MYCEPTAQIISSETRFHVIEPAICSRSVIR